MATKEKWTELFEQVIGRKPSPDEFLKGKEGGFAPIEIRSIAGLDKVEAAEPVATPAPEEDVFEMAEEPLFDQETSAAEPVDATAEPEVVEQAEEIFDVAEEPIEQEMVSEVSQQAVAEEELAQEIFDVAEEPIAEPVDEKSAEVSVAQLEQSPAAQPSEQDPRTKWMVAFEHYIGRKPSPDEFIIGKNQGYDLTSIHQFLNQQPRPVKLVKPAMPKWKKALISAVVIVLAGAGFGYYYAFNNYFSREAVAKNYLKVAGKNFNKAMTYEVWSDTKKAVKNSELKYTNKDKVITTNRESSLLSGSAMVKVGQKYLIFPDWRIAVTPVDATVTSNTKGLAVTINGKEWETTDSDKFSKKVEKLYPGQYDFAATGTVNNQKIEVSTQEELTKDTDISLDVSYMSFTVNSNLSDGDLYMGSTKLGTLSNGKLSLTNTAVNSSAKLYVKKTFEDSSVTKSETYAIDDLADGDTITLDAEGVLSRDVANDLMEAAYSKLNSYSSSHRTPDDLDDVFLGGHENGFYKDVVNVIETNTTNAKNRSADSITFSEVDVTKVTQTGAKTYVVEFTVLYDFYYGYSSSHRSSGDIKQKMSWSAKVEYQGSNSDDDDYYYDDYENYVITDQNSKSSVLNTKNTVS